MTDAILEVQNLKKYFRTSRGMLHAVDDVSFTIERGKTLGVVGESGCGKSTLGRTILHLHEPTEGTIFFDGKDISHPSHKELKELRKDMQMIFQDPFSSLDPRMSVSQLIAEPMIIYRSCPRGKVGERMTELMELVGLASRLKDAYPHELDGGRRQRIGIARALSLDSKFIVCDEPVSALDVSIQAQILNLMQDIQEAKKLTYIFITHDMSVVKHVSDRIMVMYLGMVVESGDPQEIFEHRLHPYTQALMSAIPIPELGAKKKRQLLKGEISSPIEPGTGCRFAKRCIYATEKCYQETPAYREVRQNHFVACHYAKD